MKKILAGVFAIILLLGISGSHVAHAEGNASIGGLVPSNSISVGTPVSFSVVASGFINPKYTVIDSFPGGVTSTSIDPQGNFAWIPNSSDVGTHTITVTVNDSRGTTAVASQMITVITVGITQSAVTPSATVRYGTPLSFTLSSSGFLSPRYTVADTFRNSTITNANTNNDNGAFQWTPVYQDIGTHTLVSTVQDYRGTHVANTSQVITVQGPTNIILTSGSQTMQAWVGRPVTFSATTSGMTNPTLTVSDAFTSTLGTSTLKIDEKGTVSWTPVYNDIGVHPITISATDTLGNSGQLLITITVLPADTLGINETITNFVPAPGERIATLTQLSTSSSTLYIFRNFLNVGSSGKDVTALQQLLVHLGFLSAAPTGYYGQVTRRAVIDFQKAHGLSPLGYVGPGTRTALNLGK